MHLSFLDCQEDINHKIESFYDTVSNVFANLNIKSSEWEDMQDLYENIVGKE